MKAFDLILTRVVVVFVFGASMISSLASTNVVVCDVVQGKVEKVPSNLMELEKDPLKSASDPGYYGRDYVFRGDAVVKNSALRVFFSKRSNRAQVFRFMDGSSKEAISEDPNEWAKSPSWCYCQIVPGTTNRMSGFDLIRNGADEVVLQVNYGPDGGLIYTFGDNEIIEVKPVGSIKSVRFVADVEYAIAPGFVGDDLIFKTQDVEGDKISLPAENMLVNLLGSNEGRVAVLTWTGKKTVTAKKASYKDHEYFSEMEIETPGEPVFIAALAAPGIWHREKLGAEFLEKDHKIDWKPPFMARWKTQLAEGNGKTTYAFRHAKGTVWRGVAGSYNYPVWFDGATANFSLSKKVPPKGEAVIYFLEGDDTPSSVLTPVDVLKATLGRPLADKILDVEGRKLRTHHGDAGSNVHRACTCGYTEAIQAVFEKGEECDKKQFVDQSIQDMIYFVKMHLARIDEYRAFATKLSEYLQATAKSNPALKDYLEDLDATAQQIPAEYENQKENMKSLDYAAELEKRTMALTGKKAPENLKRYMELLKLWRGMGGAQDGVVAQYHILARKIFQDAGYNCASIQNEKAVEVAREIRARCKEILRNPDGYEIWANY
jgi:hypothetical protein